MVLLISNTIGCGEPCHMTLNIVNKFLLLHHSPECQVQDLNSLQRKSKMWHRKRSMGVEVRRAKAWLFSLPLGFDPGNFLPGSNSILQMTELMVSECITQLYGKLYVSIWDKLPKGWSVCAVKDIERDLIILVSRKLRDSRLVDGKGSYISSTYIPSWECFHNKPRNT